MGDLSGITKRANKIIFLYRGILKVKYLFYIAFLLLAAGNLSAQPGPEWSYVQTITLSQGTPLNGFQVNIELSAGQYAGMHPNGNDLRFTGMDNTPYSYWIERWNPAGTSSIWVKVPAAGTTELKMYYGNSAAAAGSDGYNTFDFFDGFDGSALRSNWKNISSGGTVIVSGGEVSLTNNNNTASIYSQFTPGSNSFIIEVKHRETKYYRNRFYASNAVSAGVQWLPSGISDYGLWGDINGSVNGHIQWDGNKGNLTALTDYLTRWDITEGSTFRWSNYNYNTGTQLSSNNKNVSAPIRYLNFAVTEATYGSTIIDWVRVRKNTTAAYTPAITFGPRVSLPPFIESFTPASQCVSSNITVTIHGFHLTGASSVTFNGVAAQSFTVTNDQTIVATSQPGVTSGVIKVTTADGTATSASQLLIYPIPQKFTLSAPSGSLYCTGSDGLPISLSGSETGVDYQLFKNGVGGSIIPGTGNPIVFPNQTTGGYYVEAVNHTTGCSETMTGTVNISENVISSFSVMGTSAYCQNSNGVPVGLSGSQAGADYTLFRDGAVVITRTGTGSAINFGNYAIAGTYTVVATLNGCTQDMVGSAALTENPLPSGSLTFEESSGTLNNDGKICTGDLVTFTASPDPAFTYKFFVNGSPDGPATTSNIYSTTSLPAGNTTIKVEITNTQTGCSIISDEDTIIVNNLPTPALNVNINNVCPGVPITFTASGGSLYSFFINGVRTGGPSPANSITRTDFQDGDVVYAEVTNNNGCVAPTSPITVVIKPMPGIAGKITGDDIFCQVTPNVPFSTGDIDNATSYVWTYSGNGATINGTGKNVTVDFASNATSGVLSVRGQNGCGLGDPYPVDFNITVKPLPEASINGTTTICQDAQQPYITFTGSNGTAPYSFIYSVNGGSPQTASTTSGNNTVQVPVVTTAAGTFIYELQSVSSSMGCSTTITGSATVTVSPKPLTPAKPTGAIQVCQGGSGSYHVAAITHADVDGYHWSYSGTGATINGTGKDITIDFASNATSGELTVYASNSCGNGPISGTLAIQINTLPTATVGIDGNNQACQNATGKPGVIFTGTNGTAPYTFTYNINGGTSKTITSSGNSVTVYAPTDVTGTFTYNLVGITDATATHCYNPQSGSVQIVIDTLPVPVLLGPDLICADQTLDYETQSGNGIHDYAWTISNGSIEAGGTATDHTARVHWNNNTGPKSIYVNYTDGNGCQGATQVSVKSTSPTVPAFSSGPKVVCLNTEDAVYTVQGGFSDYAWEITGGVITGGGGSDDNTATVTWNAAGNQTISVNFNSGTCSAPAPTAYPVKVNPLPSASISANNLSVCQNDVAPVITFTGAEGQANYTFYYTKDGSASTIISSGNTAAITQPTNSPGTFVYVLDKVMDANGCEQPQPATVEVTVHTLPVATISKTPDVCIGSSSKPEITFTASNGTAPYKFTYKINGSVQPPAISTGGTYVFQVSTATAAIYEYELVSVEDVNGCTQMIADQNVTVTINPLPTATISGPDSVCAGSPANITLHGAGGTPEYTFIYKINGGADQTATTVSGNDAVINVNTATPGIYKYTLVSVQDASSSACQQLQTSSWTIVVSTPTVGGTVNGNKTICSGQTGSVTLSGETGKILRWESSTDGVSWNVINNTTHTLSYTALTVTTQYRAVIKSGFCGVEYSTAATITVNEANGGLMNVGNTHTNSKTVCAGTNLPVVVSGYTGTIQRWETSVDGGAHWIVQSEHDYFLNVLNIQQTTWYRVLTENLPCGPVYSEVAKVNVTPRPTGHIEGSTQICVGGSATITLQLTGAGTIQGTLSDGTPFSGVEGTPVYLTVSPGVPGTTYTISTLSDASCQAVAEKGDMDGVANIIVTAIPGPVVIKPEAATICKGGIVPLTSVLGQVENPEPISISKIVNMTIPNQDETTGVQSSIAVSGIPLGAIVDSVTAKFNVTHEMIDGVKINLGAPNGKVINIVNEVHGSNLTNTVIHSDATTHNIISSGSAPYTGIYSAYGEGTYSTQVGTSNTNTFTDLFGTITAPPNGNWTLFVYDVAPFATGTFDNWTLTIYYHVPVQSVKIIWSPVDGLYTDPSATIPYKSTDTLATVYAKPDTTITYTGTSANPASCTPPTQVTITMNPPPVVTINADYCAVSDKVQLTAHSEPPAETYTWSTGETSPTVDVDVAHVYVVSAKTSLGCVASAAMSVAQELVKNGDFEAPFDHNNPGFVTGYRWRASPNPPTPNSGSGGLRDERTYAVDTNAHIYHSLFYGYDHTSPVKHGKFMMINGATTEGVTIWQQTVNVLPNTNYYYSAWGTNLTAGNSARLQFSVNGVPMGTTAELSNIPSYEWRRFYYGSTNGWYSGSNTTAVIQIINLNPAAGGNDFGLDDISFATLAPFISKTGVPGSEVQELCKGDSIIPITYNIGTGGGGPEILNLPKGLHADFNGIVLAITGVPDTAGTFNFTVKTQGSCPDPVMASGTIKVNGQNLRLASAVNTDAQVICNSTGIAPIRYKINGQGSETSGAYAVGLPNGLSGSFNPGTKEFTITGAPDDTSGVFTYKVFVTGDYCHTDSIEGKITVNRQLITRIAGHNDQTLCINTPMESIQYEVAGTGTGAHVNGLPQGVSGTFNNGVFTISGQPETPGSFEYVITTDGTCSATALTGTIEVNSDASIELSSAPGTDAQEICFGAGITQIKYSTGGNVANVSFEDLPGNVSGTYNNGQVTLTGLPEAAGDYNYTITATGSCASADIKGDIIVNAPVEGGTLSLHYGSDCGGTGTIQLAGNSGDVKGWEKSEDGGNSWVFLSDTDDQLSFAVSKSTYYRAVIDGRSCSDENSNAVLVGLHNVWTGSQNTDWQNNQNWSDGMLPSFSSTCPNVVIPEVSTGKYPVLSTGTASVNNIVIEQHAMVTVNGGKLRIAGAITNDGVLDATHGTLEFNGSAAQTISGSMFKQKQVREVIVSNSAGLAVTNNGTDTLKISGILNFASSATKLNTGDNITLLSDINHTASLGVVRSSNIINGKFIVERYIHVGPGAHEKAWLLLAAPVTGQSIHDSWMEGGSTTVHGYGTQMTGVTGSSGFDLISPAPSIKYWSPQDNNWIGVLSAGAPVHNKEGYMVFVRGDRTAGYGDAANPTKLRAKGTVVTGKTILNVPQVADGFASLGNPYPSAIDLTKLTFSGTDPQPTVYVWNPNIGGDYGYGAYESYTKINGNFVTVPGGAVNNYIQSGQAFFVQTSNEPEVTITVNEDSKIALSNNTTYFRPMGRGGLEVPGTLMTNIFSGSKTSGTPADGTLQLFNNRYNNAIDLNDGRKLYNTGVSLAIDKEGNYLVVERRPELNRRDTIAFRTTGMTTSGGYTLQFNAIELNKPGLEAWLEDAFTGAKTPVNLDGLTNVEFSVTSDARSKAANRFRLVFENTKAPLPVTFISISAQQKDKVNIVNWKVAEQAGSEKYVIQKSTDGIHFNDLDSVRASGHNDAAYSWADQYPVNGFNYYRIKMVDHDNRATLSAVVRVTVSELRPTVTVIPNPIQGGVLNLWMKDMKPGRYQVRLLNSAGQILLNRMVTYTAGWQKEMISWDYKLPHGTYQLELTGEDGGKRVLTIMY